MAHDGQVEADVLQSTAPIAGENLYAGVLTVLNLMTSQPACLKEPLQSIRKVLEEESLFVLTPDLEKQMRQIFADPCFLQAKETSWTERHVHPSFIFFFDQFMESFGWGLAGSRLTVHEYLQVHIRTSGLIVDMLPPIHGKQIRLWDSGGQRCERRKWPRTFEDADVFVYAASLADYDEVLYEDSSKNRLEESFEVFESLVATADIATRPIVVVLTKRDLLGTKLARERVPLNVSGLFPTSPDTFNVDVAEKWISDEFRIRSERYGRKAHIRTLTTTSYGDVTEFVRHLLSTFE